MKKLSKKEIINHLSEYFKTTDSPNDDEIHKLAKKLGVNKHEFETHIYSMLSSFLSQGRAIETNTTEDSVDKEQLSIGIKIEMEHTNNTLIAKRIALDHLAEISDYYTRLTAMEKEAKE